MKYSDMDRKIRSLPSTPVQDKIVNDNKYPRYLKAGAGSGKTEVLTRKIMEILAKEDVSLDNFVIITFTNKATEEMKERISQKLYYYWLGHPKTGGSQSFKTETYVRKQVEISSMVQISTIHSFCEGLLRRYGIKIGIAPNFKVKSIKHSQNNIIIETIDKYTDNPILESIPDYKIKNLIEKFLFHNNSKGFEFTEEIVSSLIPNPMNSTFWNEFEKIFCDIYLEVDNRIEEFKRLNNIIQTDDLIKRAAQLLKDEYILKKVIDKYRYVFIDEFQDTNSDQFQLVKSLMEAGSNIFLVGDEKQSIYAFRGSDVQNSKNMSKIIDTFSEAEKYSMSDNFRTDYLLLEDINKVFSQDYYYEKQKLYFDKENMTKLDNLKDLKLSDEKPFNFVNNTDLITLIKYIKNQTDLKMRKGLELVIKDGKIIKRKVEYRDMAILCRSNYDLDVYAQMLKSTDIPYEIFGGKGFYKSKEIIDTYKIFNYILNQSSVYETELKFTDYYTAIKSNLKDINFNQFLDDLKVTFRRETIEGILDFIYKRSEIKEYYYSRQKYQAIANLNKLKEVARNLMVENYLQPLEFLDYLNNMISAQVEEDEAEISKEHRDTSSGVVSLYSIHKAKGLQFPIVIVPKIEKQINRKLADPKIIYHDNPENGEKRLAFDYRDFPNDNDPDFDYDILKSDKIKEYMEEELRILYVALTRAEHRLYLQCEDSRMISRNRVISWAKWLNEIDGGSFARNRMLAIT